MNKYILVLLGILIISYSPLINAVDTLGSVKQNDVIGLYEYCDSCTFVNLTSVKYPNGTIINFNNVMTKSGTNYNYSWNDTSSLGDYFYTVCGDKDGTLACEDIKFIVTPSGYSTDSPKSNIMIITLVILIVIGVFTFIFGMASRNIPIKIFFLSITTILIIFSIGYTMNIMKITIGEFSSLQSNFLPIYIIGIVLLSGGAIALILYLIVSSFKAFYRARGMIPEEEI